MSRASIGDYVVTSKLGSGSFAVVYKGYHKLTKVPVAIKALPLIKLNAKLLQNLELEIAIMRQIDHPNVVKLYEIKKTDKYMYLVLEYCAGGDLQQYLRRQQHRGEMALSERVAQHFLFELAKGIKCLWTHNLIHRDLKPQNLLLTEDSETAGLKIADFGFARHLAQASMAETLCGSPLYMAPEILRFQKYDAKADLWSVGAILYEMVIGKPPFGGANHVQLLANIERRELQFPDGITLSDACRNLVSGLLQRSPLNRMGFVEFFRDLFVALGGDLDGGLETVGATTSIQEEDEEDQLTGSLGSSMLSSQRPSLRSRSITESYNAKTNEMKVPSPGRGSLLRSSRSGNIEVMQTAFGSTSGGNPSAPFSSGLRRSRLGRRSGSGGTFLLNQVGNSPRLSPQLSPDDLPAPSPRINPFKEFADSPPSVTHGTALRASLTSRVEASVTPAGTAVVVHKTGGGHALDSSGEYVLVETESAPRGASPAIPPLKPSFSQPLETLNLPAQHGALQGRIMTTIEPSGRGSFSHEYAQQLVDITTLRIQAIAPIAEHLWKMSCALQVPMLSGSGNNLGLGSVFSLSSSSSSSSEHGMSGVTSSSQATASEPAPVEKKQFIYASEALALYVKCLRMIQHALMYLRLDPALSKRLSAGSNNGSPPKPPASWTDPSRKLSMAFLVEQLNLFLDRADQCKRRMSAYTTSISAQGDVNTINALIESQEELLYSHAIRLGKEGAIKEVLGQARAASELYLQAMLLLESLLMESSTGAPTAALMPSTSSPSLSVDDQKRVAQFLKALEQRLKTVKQSVEEAHNSSRVSQLPQMAWTSAATALSTISPP